MLNLLEGKRLAFAQIKKILQNFHIMGIKIRGDSKEKLEKNPKRKSLACWAKS